MGERSVVHFIAQTFLILPKGVFNLFNSFVMILFILLIYMHANNGKKWNIPTLIIILFLVWNFIPAFGQTTLWLTGTCNYLWGTTLILLFLLPFRMSLNQPIQMKWYQGILFAIFGLLAGWTNENTSAAMIL